MEYVLIGGFSASLNIVRQWENNFVYYIKNKTPRLFLPFSINAIVERADINSVPLTVYTILLATILTPLYWITKPQIN